MEMLVLLGIMILVWLVQYEYGNFRKKSGRLQIIGRRTWPEGGNLINKNGRMESSR